MKATLDIDGACQLNTIALEDASYLPVTFVGVR
jgi:hypothetical protein